MNWKLKKFTIDQAHYFNYSTFFITKFNWLINIIVLIGVYGISRKFIPLIAIGGIIFIQFLGFVMDKTGFLDAFNSRTNKGTIDIIVKEILKQMEEKK